MMKQLFQVTVLLSLILFYSCDKKESNISEPEETYYEKSVKFPSGATLEQKIDMPSRLVPRPQQLAWHKMELIAFIHFGMNTFTGKEWGDGKEDPALFDPTGLNAEQWVQSLKEAGFKMMILTAKHHDGFCLWQTQTTNHSVASSPWKNGKGDLVREVRNACDKFGMKFGIYLSPWDRNAASYGTSEYNQFYVRQLTELLSNYGTIHEVWFDGANGEALDNKKQVYDWDAFIQTVNRLQPEAVTAIAGDDVRWIGNENGIGRATEWSATVYTPPIYARAREQHKKLDVYAEYTDLGSRDLLEKADELFWFPSEADVSIRPGWFYHEEENNQVKPLSQLIDVYFQSVGYNSVLLLNTPPDKRGVLHDNDVQRLREFSSYLNNTFSSSHVKNGTGLHKLAQNESIEFELNGSAPVNVLSIQEDISRGQRVENFIFEAWVNGKWEKVAEGTTIGHKRLLKIAPVQTTMLKLTITKARNNANISFVGAYYAEPLPS